MKIVKLSHGETMRITWHTLNKKPICEDRILVFSSCYSKGDPMRFRTIDSQFLKTCNDVDMWAYIPEPTQQEKP